MNNSTDLPRPKTEPQPNECLRVYGVGYGRVSPLSMANLSFMVGARIRRGRLGNDGQGVQLGLAETTSFGWFVRASRREFRLLQSECVHRRYQVLVRLVVYPILRSVDSRPSTRAEADLSTADCFETKSISGTPVWDNFDRLTKTEIDSVRHN